LYTTLGILAYLVVSFALAVLIGKALKRSGE
jgi:hypothetical protein